MNEQPKRNCLECNQLTDGCITKAGYRIACLCQSCKDKADADLELLVRKQGDVANKIFARIFGEVR